MLRSLGLPLAVAVLAFGVLAVVSACAGDEDPLARAAQEAGPEHVHGLGLNSADGSLYIATHTGLFRMKPGSDDFERVGDRLQDTMGFAIVGPDRFIGSGHPDLRDDLPPLLGLIESSDAGRSWDSVSLLGEADFHALRVRGSRVVGYDASGGRVMTSSNGGRTWRSSSTPAALADLAVDPVDPDHLVAASEAGLIASLDAGSTWSPLAGIAGIAIALAWPAPDALYALAPDGAVSLSADGGESWAPRGNLPGEPAAVTALDADSLIVALHDGAFASSSDGGRSWSPGAWSWEGS
jgi:photosystem II stability/assembly factor-like uncharacterized protein